jgi:Cd2+/Zn2+-exporting ATPase/Cu+-exporting ATPase
MCCADEAAQVERALGQLDGVLAVQTSLVTETVTIDYDPSARAFAVQPLTTIRQAIEGVGCSVPKLVEGGSGGDRSTRHALERFPRQVLAMLGLVFGAVLLVVIVGEWLGFLDVATARVPWPLGLAVVLVAGYPVFRDVLQAALHRRITSHTLMTVGALAALIVGDWAAAAVVVFFMRVGDYVERFTTARARRAVKDLTAMAPQMARVERGGAEQEVPVGELRVGEIVIVRPGEQIPVDGDVLSGQATVDQAAITGESMPAEVGPGARVFAATLARLGSLRIRATHVGPETTFGRVITMVEEAEAHRGEVQRLADRFSGYYLPVVLTMAGLTLVFRHDPLATAAVLVVACSCAFALATPVAMLASIGAGARRGLLIKGGKYLEALARADVLLLDKTGTLTLGRPHLTDIIAMNGASDAEVLCLAAAAEHYSEHPLAEAVRAAAWECQCPIEEPQAFEAIPGMGVRARVRGRRVTVGNRRMLAEATAVRGADDLEAQGKTLLFVAQEGTLIGVLAAADTLRPEVPQALAAVRALGVNQIELLTGDHERAAAALAERLGVSYHASLLPEEKIAIVKAYQAKGHTVIMVGDGVNDAPALAQADVGIAMGAAGTDVAMEAAHLALMRDDWTLVPEALRMARRTMRVVKLNIAFTAVYNLTGLALAALGFLPLIGAAAAQSLPDLGILANSSRLLRQGKSSRSPV